VTLVDSNVLLDIFIQTPDWWEWSLARLEDAARQGPLLINDVIFAETSIRFSVIEDFESALSQAGITVAPIPRMALGLHSVPQCGRRAQQRAAGFFYWRSCSGRTASAFDT
jgi:hypothetical protein